MASQLYTVKLLGKDWFVDERLKEYRSIARFGEKIIVFNNQQMDDMLMIKEILDNPTEFEVGRDTLTKMKILFGRAMKGDMKAIEIIAKICNDDDCKVQC